MIKFLPSYVGSKSFWVKKLECLQGNIIVEMFAGSAVISANLASKALLVEKDPYVAWILEHFDELIVFDEFDHENYYHYRDSPEWYYYIYNLQKMSFSGVFRYSTRRHQQQPVVDLMSPSGFATKYNVPAKKTLNKVYPKESYMEALHQWKKISPAVFCGDYKDVDIGKWCETFNGDLYEVIIVLDPPYEDSQANYNNSFFDYDHYWKMVQKFYKAGLSCVVFDRKSNLEAQGYVVHADNHRKMRVNGARQGDVESMISFGPICEAIAGNGMTFSTASVAERKRLVLELCDRDKVISNKSIRERFRLPDSESVKVSQVLFQLKTERLIEKTKPKTYERTKVENE